MKARDERKRLEGLAKVQETEEKRLAGLISAELVATDRTSVKRGAFRAVLETIAGRVSWKDAWQELKAVAEKAGVSVETPTAPDGVRFAVVPVE